jgi:hypothetical protein
MGSYPLVMYPSIDSHDYHWDYFTYLGSLSLLWVVDYDGFSTITSIGQDDSLGYYFGTA